jgi:poly(3-hydroxybutyrate) depolymerase
MRNEIRNRVSRMACGAALLTTAALAASSCARHQDSPSSLPSLHIDPARVAVAGLSSGAYMATQAQLAYPEIFHDAAMISGGPYGCAQGKIENAVSMCMKGEPAPDAAALAATARERAAKGELGPLAKLAGAKVYILHGRSDPVIADKVARAAADFYTALKTTEPALATLEVSYDGERDFTHTMPTLDAGNPCDKLGAPFLGKCGFDAAGAVFAALYGAPPRQPQSASGELRRFDQNALRQEGKDAFLADLGYVYVPPACAAGKPCGVLVALHGCQQNSDSVGEAFVRDAGFNRWADVYDVAVLYPQTRASFTPLNPKACWDWFGYSGANYDTRDAVQLRWLVRALTALGRPAS